MRKQVKKTNNLMDEKELKSFEEALKILGDNIALVDKIAEFRKHFIKESRSDEEIFKNGICACIQYYINETGKTPSELQQEFQNKDKDMIEYAWWLQENLRQFADDQLANSGGAYLKMWKRTKTQKQNK